jgi:hypothetical protein
MPTLYLASDQAVALAELARHLREERSRETVSGVLERQVFRLDLEIDSLFDLRDPAVTRELSLRNAPACFLDRQAARAVALFLRKTTSAHALLVPSIAFLDDPERWILVLFLEKLPSDADGFIQGVRAEGTFRVEG